MLADEDTIDMILKKDKTGRIGLVMTAHEAWDPTTLEQLRKKLAGYVSYIRGPRYLSRSGGAPAFIKLVCLHEATAEVHSLLTATSKSSGISIETEQFTP